MIVRKTKRGTRRARCSRWKNNPAAMRRAARLRSRGASYRDIADALGCSVFTAYYLVQQQ